MIFDYLYKLLGWVYSKNNKPISGNSACRHCGKKPVLVKVKIPADLSSTGKIKWKKTLIDNCLANIVKALQKGKVDMRGCCCGHGKGFGDIHLQDDRVLVIVSGKWYYNGGKQKIEKIYNGNQEDEKINS